MSLVAYASSDESEPDEAEPEEEEAAAPAPGPTLGGLFASLPAPKGPALLPPPPQMLAPAFPPPLLLPPPSGDPRLQPPPPLPFGLGGFPPPPGVSPAEAAGVGEALALGLPAARGPGLSLPPPLAGAGPALGLPKPKKRTEPVKIAAPELHQGDVSTGGWGGAPPAATGCRHLREGLPPPTPPLVPDPWRSGSVGSTELKFVNFGELGVFVRAGFWKPNSPVQATCTHHLARQTPRTGFYILAPRRALCCVVSCRCHVVLSRCVYVVVLCRVIVLCRYVVLSRCVVS